MKIATKILIILMTLFIFNGCFKEKIEPETVENFEIENFLGKWYEVGRITTKFEKDLVGVTATYTLKENGDIKVLNKGYKNELDGKIQAIEGKAKIPNPDNPSKLKVYFFPIFGADYNVISVKGDYDYALIGGSTPDYLWILSRTRRVDEEIYNKLLQRAKEEGYNVDKVERVLQPEEKKESDI
ncbi:MAG: lipocalin family protein [Fusobacteriota bacterium]